LWWQETDVDTVNNSTKNSLRLGLKAVNQLLKCSCIRPPICNGSTMTLISTSKGYFEMSLAAFGFAWQKELRLVIPIAPNLLVHLGKQHDLIGIPAVNTVIEDLWISNVACH
jgi:hypothetical protein